MPITVKHSKVSTIPDAGDSDLVRPSDWNADHTLTGLGTMAEQNANNVNITGGTISGVSGFGDVVGPASSTDNAIARFDSTTGKLLQNSVVTVGDTGAVTGVTTFSASTSVTTPIVQASNSGGLALKNSAGTTQISMGGGGGDNVSINVATNINGANAQIDISPTGTGHVHIKPTGTGSLEIAPTNAGTMNNMVIGGTTPLAGSFTNLSVTGTLSFDAAEGTAGQVLTSAGTGVTPTWTTPTTGTVTSVAATAGTGISVSGSPITTSGTLTITNTAPDQTVVLTAGTGISTSGTYPNFTITNTAPSSGGTVTSVTGTAPVVSSGGNTPAISMAAATGSVNGYLTSTDWTTFNGKANAFTYTSNYIPYGQGTTTPTQSVGLQYNGTTFTTTGISTSNNLTFTGTGNRITGLFDGTPQSNRVAFQTSTTNAQTAPIAIPNGTIGSGATASGFVFHDSNFTSGNSSSGSIANIQSTEIRISSGIQGAGTYLPLTMHTGGSERLRIDTSGNVGIGTSSPATILNAYNATSAIIQLDGDSTTIVRPTRYSTDASPSQFVARKARGTLASPTSVATSDTAGGIFIQAYGGTNFRNIARIDGLVETYTSDTNIAGALRFYTNTSTTDVTEKMRIDSSGLVGIGTTTPSSFGGGLVVRKSNTAQGVTNATAQFSDAVNSALWIGHTSGAANIVSEQAITFGKTDGSTTTERMRIDTSGNLLVGTTTLIGDSSKLSISYNYSNSGIGLKSDSTATHNAIMFYNPNGNVGTIQTSASLTLYNTTSDYRLKTVIGVVTNAGQRIDALEPIEYEWKVGGRTKGFLAHKFAEVYPNSVSGEKDAVDKKGKPVYQSMQASTAEVMADLIAEIQSLRKRVATLESK